MPPAEPLTRGAVPGWAPRPAPRPRSIEGRWVAIRSLERDHTAALHCALFGSPDDSLWTLRPEDRPADQAATGAPVERWWGDPVAATVVLVPLEGDHAGTPSGVASYLAAEPGHGSIEIGAILLARHLQRTRAATEALHLLLAQAVEGWG